MIPIKRYLTDEDYAIAKSNGVSTQLAYARFYVSDWSAERAITEPPGKYHSGNYKELLKQAHENGVMITLGGLYQRIYKGMSEHEAITKPLMQKDKYIAQAESNGISHQTYYSRRKSGWDKELASTWPVGKSRRKPVVKPTASDSLSESEIDRILKIEVGSPHNSWW